MSQADLSGLARICDAGAAHNVFHMLLISFNSRQPASRRTGPQYAAFAESADLDLCTLKPDLTDIDVNHQHFLNRLAVRPARVGAALGRQMNSVCHDIV
jgi:hypothetical protein